MTAVRKRVSSRPAPPVPLIGAHMSIAGGPVKALERGRSIGCAAVQIFVKNNMQWFAKPLSEDEAARFRHSPDHPGMVFGHTGYLINLGTDRAEFIEKSVRSLAEELVRADQLQLPFLVLHPGAHLGQGEEPGLARIAHNLDAVFRALPDGHCKVALEITAGQGSSLGHTFEQLAGIISRSAFPERLRICLDTAHLFAAGYDISTAKGFWKVIKRFERVLGWDRLAAWHLNDSKASFNSRVDRHDHIGKGKIGLEPFREIMRAREFGAIPKVLETPKQADLKEDIENLAVLRGLMENATNEQAEKCHE